MTEDKAKGIVESVSGMSSTKIQERRKNIAEALIEGKRLNKPKNIAYSLPVKSVQQRHLEQMWGIPRMVRDIVEAITTVGGAAAIPEEWVPEIARLPIGLLGHLRDVVTVYDQLKGEPGDTLHIPRITTPQFAALAEGVAPADVVHTITALDVILTEYGGAQEITDSLLEDIVGNLLGVIDQGFVDAAIKIEDAIILDTLDAVPDGNLAGVVYGGDAVSEITVDALDIFDEDLLAESIRQIDIQGYSTDPGKLTCVLDTRQHYRLAVDNQFKQANVYGTRQLIETGRVPGWQGISLLKSGDINVGLGAGSPAVVTYHAWVFPREAVGLAPKRELRVESDRDIQARTTLLMGSHRFGAGVLFPAACVKIVTAP